MGLDNYSNVKSFEEMAENEESDVESTENVD